MKCVEVYKELYHQEPYGVAFCPYASARLELTLITSMARSMVWQLIRASTWHTIRNTMVLWNCSR